MTNKHAAVWFEIPATNYERAINFYETVLGVTLQREEIPGAPRMAIFPYDKEGGVGGSVMEAPEGCVPSAGGVILYLSAGDDLAGPLGRVESAGGKVTMPKTQISPEIGYIAHLIDTEGNRVSFHSFG